MKFTKMQGIGNDYVYVNCFEEQVTDPAALAVRISDRHFGVGSDGLILILPSKEADFEMDMYNADGSRGKMCGNGIRCVGKYVYDHGLTDRTEITVATGSGVKTLEMNIEGGKVSTVRVDMGKPVFTPAQIPIRPQLSGGPGADALDDAEMFANRMISAGGREWKATCVSMGNPHCVVPVDDVDHLPITQIGPSFEEHPMFPERVNTEFIKVLDPETVQMRVWERGSGETLACGTGACAVAAACALNGWTGREVTVKLLGGDLQICWDEQDGHIYMTGPARTVFEGEWPED